MKSLVLKAGFTGVFATASCLTFAQATPSDASAAAATPAVTAPLTANISFTTHYKFRGQDQDTLGHDGNYKKRGIKPAVQGGFDYAFGDSGFYVGNWNSSVNWLSGNSVEMDFYGGYKMKAGLFDLDFGALTYVYPGNRLGNTTELYAATTYANEQLGAVTLKYSHTVSRDYFGFAGSANGSGIQGRNTGYLNLSYAKEVAPHLTLKAAVGYTHLNSDIRRSTGYKSYVDYNVGASYDFGGGLSLAGAVQGGNKKEAYLATVNPGYDVGFGPVGIQTQSINKPRLIATLTKSF
ncbi:TorF family putative porin [Variovorax sp. PAMC 28711]|uniref:TorF family putative porin n=1 Tax=Variovorax sp. PAMC 28711 TaxID=1795631 RepID=UPI00078D1B46|nr:TorF family putative porin [Variovorax sp. PAMC 28711]AMM26125.1 hypothetical protein AX767_18525 [Variovorax sp. PAMC 28711]